MRTTKEMKPTRVTYRVTQKMIEEAIKANSSHCMMQAAIAAANPNLKFIAVDIQTIRYTDMTTGVRNICLTPRQCQQYIIDWDQGTHPKPFGGELRPSQVVRAGKKFLKAGGNPAKIARPVDKKTQPTLFDLPSLKKTKATKANNRATLVRGHNHNDVPLKVGGATPPVPKVRNKSGKMVPQMSNRREFGIRAYR